MRWDIIPADLVNTDNTTVENTGFLRLEADYPTLCAFRQSATTSLAVLQPCSDPGAPLWVYDYNIGVIRYALNPALCLTVSRCVQRNDAARSCIQTVEIVETDPARFVEGSVIHLKSCWDVDSSKAAYQPAQTYTRELDCVAGCSPQVLNNGECDQICNIVACAYDKGECGESSPTPSPTESPTIFPTRKPTLKPTKIPTTTKVPTATVTSYAPTFKPTAEPTLTIVSDPLTTTPTLSPISSTSAFPDNIVAYHSYWWVLFFVLMVCCCATFFLFVGRKRRINRRKVFDSSGDVDEMEGISSDKLVPEVDEEEEERFKTGSAVALNQLRYHSRAATSGTVHNDAAWGRRNQSGSGSVHNEHTWRRSDTSNSERTVNFEEVGV